MTANTPMGTFTKKMGRHDCPAILAAMRRPQMSSLSVELIDGSATLTMN
jgi:hypothetical protein